MTWIIPVVIIGALVLWGVGMYNGLVRLRNQVRNAWSQIDVQLKRRHDLIPNLVETAKGYMKHERETLETITKARNLATGAQGVAEQGRAEGQLSQALSNFFVVVEKLSRPEGQRQLHGASGGANVHGKQGWLFPPALGTTRC